MPSNCMYKGGAWSVFFSSGLQVLYKSHDSRSSVFGEKKHQTWENYPGTNNPEFPKKLFCIFLMAGHRSLKPYGHRHLKGTSIWDRALKRNTQAHTSE